MADRTRRANGDGTFTYDPKSRRWVGQASAGRNPATGKRRRIKRTGATKTEAARKLKAAVAAAEIKGSFEPSESVTALLTRWLEAGAPSRKRKGPAWLKATEELTCNHLIPTLGHHRVSDLQVEHVEAMLAARTHLSRSTVARLRMTLAQAYDYAIARRSAQWNPARAAIVPEVDSSPAVRRALTADEAGVLLSAAKQHRLGAWVVLTLSLGLRPGECSALTWDSVDLDAGVVVVHATKTKTTRTLRLPSAAIEALRAHRLRQVSERLSVGNLWTSEHDALVFRTEAGTPLEAHNTRRFVKTLARLARIAGTVTPYDLRHTATTRLSAAGVAPELLADLLGHKDTRMVFAHYRHRVTPVVEVAAVGFAEAFGS